MNTPILLSVVFCVASLAALLWLLRRDQLSLGIPLGYLGLLLLDHLPGAVVQLFTRVFYYDTAEVETGIRLTAIGCVCFTAGVFLAHAPRPRALSAAPVRRSNFWIFCLMGGWTFTFLLGYLVRIPSISAVISTGGAIWMLGVTLGLRWALYHGRTPSALFWLATLMVFPVVGLLSSGFLSYGAAALIVVCSALAITARKYWRVATGLVLAGLVGVVVFIGYFESRTNIRDAVWGGQSLENRVEAVSDAFGNFQLSDPLDVVLALYALDARLNQNYFVGLAAERLDRGEVSYLSGQSIEQSVLAFVPRLLWPTKPVFAGSPEIVSKMTGLPLAVGTSWGVGNVMEFYINFGYASLILGFVLLGWLLGFLDRQAAIAEMRGDFGKLILCFLPAVALIQPLGSMVELSGGGVAAVLAALCWQCAWAWWSSPPRRAEASVPQP